MKHVSHSKHCERDLETVRISVMGLYSSKSNEPHSNLNVSFYIQGMLCLNLPGRLHIINVVLPNTSRIKILPLL